MMRRVGLYIIIALIFAALPTACVKVLTPEPEPVLESYTVGLTTDGDLTRGPAIMSEDEILSIGIFGYSTGTENFDHTNSEHTPNLFNNREATRINSSSPWVYTPLALWPNSTDEKSTFFAYGPYYLHERAPADMSLSLTNDTYGYPQIYYKVPEIISQQVDLLYSEPGNGLKSIVRDINYTSNTTNTGNVLYNMKHALIWIRFVFAAEEEITDTDRNDQTNPRYPFTRDETYTISELLFYGGNIHTEGYFNMGTGTWSHPKPMSSAVYRFDNIDDNPLTLNAGTVTPLTTARPGNCLMLIPHSFVTSENLTSIGILYSHDDGSQQGATGLQYYATLPFPDVKLNNPGYVMTFVIRLSTSGSWIEFEEENMIQKWDENLDKREIEAH